MQEESQQDGVAEPATQTENTAVARIAELEAAVEEAKASVLYIKADGENIRRRAMDDIDKARKFALEKFSNELLAVKDSLDAALLIEATDVQSYKDGVELTAKPVSYTHLVRDVEYPIDACGEWSAQYNAVNVAAAIASWHFFRGDPTVDSQSSSQ